jgi:hypothetical protein
LAISVRIYILLFFERGKYEESNLNDEKLDLVIRKYVKNFEQLRRSHCNAQVHAPKALGGFGVSSLHDSAPVAYAPAYLRRLFLADLQVRSAERAAFFDECIRLSMELEVDPNLLLRSPAAFVLAMDTKVPSDIQVAWKCFGDTHGLSFEGSVRDTRSFRLCFNPTANPPKAPMDLPKTIIAVVTRMKQNVLANQRQAWANLTLQGSTMKALQGLELAPKAPPPHVAHPSNFSISERRFAILCQSNNINCRENLKSWSLAPGKECALCGDAVENTAHVLNVCRERMPLITLRHNAALAVLSRAVDKLYPSPAYEHFTDAQPLDFPTQYRPDEVIIQRPSRPNVRNGVAIIADMKTPYPATKHLGSTPPSTFVHHTHQENVSKYDVPIREQFEQLLGSASLHTVIIPSTGPVPRFTHDALQAMGFPTRSIPRLIRDMSTAAIKANYKLSATLSKPRREPAAL